MEGSISQSWSDDLISFGSIALVEPKAPPIREGDHADFFPPTREEVVNYLSHQPGSNDNQDIVDFTLEKDGRLFIVQDTVANVLGSNQSFCFYWLWIKY